MISTSDLHKGVVIEVDGDLWQILDYHHLKIGRGSAQVRIKLRNVKRGGTVERSFQAGDRWPRVDGELRAVQPDCGTARGRRELPQGEHAPGPDQLRG